MLVALPQLNDQLKSVTILEAVDQKLARHRREPRFCLDLHVAPPSDNLRDGADPVSPAVRGREQARLAANIPLVQYNLGPLSFVDVPQTDYTQAVLGVYTLNRVDSRELFTGHCDFSLDYLCLDNLCHRTMDKMEMLAGTLDLLILRVLNTGALHGFGIAERIHVLSREVLKVEEGSLYPALYRMEAKGWLKSEWGESERGRRAKFYGLTKAGRLQLETEEAVWERTSLAIRHVLKSTQVP